MGKRSNRGARIDAALDIVDNDLPDGAYWAMAGELAGCEDCEVIAHVAEHPEKYPSATPLPVKVKCPHCNRKVSGEQGLKAHIAAKHPEYLEPAP